MWLLTNTSLCLIKAKKNQYIHRNFLVKPSTTVSEVKLKKPWAGRFLINDCSAKFPRNCLENIRDRAFCKLTLLTNQRLWGNLKNYEPLASKNYWLVEILQLQVVSNCDGVVLEHNTIAVWNLARSWSIST